MRPHIFRALAVVTLICASFIICTFSSAAERALSKLVHEQLTRAQQALQQKKYDVAVKNLKATLDLTNLSTFEKATIQNFLGIAYLRKGEWILASEQLKTAFASSALETNAKRAIAYNLSQCFVHQDKWEDALKFLKKWEKGGAAQTPKENLLLANAYDRTGDQKRAIVYAEKAISVSGNEAGANELTYLLNLYYKDKRYAKALKLAERAVKLHPKNDYFLSQSAALASKLGKNDKLYNKLTAMYRLGRPTSSKQVMALAQMTMQRGAPYKAAHMLAESQAAVNAANDKAYQKLRAKALVQAREWREAQILLETMIQQDTSGAVHLMLGDVLSRQSKWPEAVAAYKYALGKLLQDKQGAAWLGRGYAELKLGLSQDALASLSRARSFSGQKEMASKLLGSLGNDSNRSNSRH